jgi:N-acetylmuramoyl-L-alanine amidase
VFLTRDGDFRVNGEEDINRDGDVDNIDEALVRVDVINEARPDVLLSIHQNGHDEGAYGGTTVYYCADRTFSDASLRLASLVHERILKAFAEMGGAIRDRGVADDNELKEPGEPGEHIIILGPETKRSSRSTSMPGVLSETLFITNDREAALAANPETLGRLALAYADAVEAYLSPAAP